jgi:hypothetical protein
MRKLSQILQWLLFVVSILPVQVMGQATSINLTTTTTSSLSASYNTWTKVDPTIEITANGNITGFKVQISQTYTSGDQLRATGTMPSGVTSSFNTTTGILVFTGTTTAANWQTVMRGVEFKSTTSSCYARDRRVTFVAGTVFYNPLTEHFYEYVTGSTTWTNSKSAAELRSYFGRVGYLATMSSEAENNFIWKLMANDGWFGASDEVSQVNTAKGTTAFASQAAVEGKWHWVTGPEKGTNFSNGNSGAGPTTVSGQYAKWAGGEPNNSSGEHYGQFYSGNAGSWNDLPNTTLPGYICEYGDMPGDQTTSTTILTRSVEIGGSSSGYITGGDINVCSGSNSTTLTLNGMTGSVVRWEWSFDNFFTAGNVISSTSTSITLTNVTKTTYYRAIVTSSSPTSCTNLATSSVFLSVKPTKAGSIFAANNSICSGGLVELTLSGQQGNINKWQRSTDQVNWTNITNTTVNLTETLNIAGTYYYRVEVQTPNCGSAVLSDNKTITVTSGTPPVGGSVSSAVHATATNSGTLSLTGYTGTIVKWQRSINDGVTWTDIANTTTSQSYSNQPDGAMYRAQLQSGTCGFTFSQPGTITVNPFTYSGYIYNSENLAMVGLSVKLLVKLKSASIYTLDQTVSTDSNGKFVFSTNYSTNKYDFRILIDGMTFSGPLLADAYFFNQKILTQSFNSKDYYRMDVNDNNDLTISDVYLIFRRITTSGTTWSGTIPEYRLFTAAQWSVINASTSNLKATYQGASAITIDNPTNGGSTNIYCVKTGHKQ